MFWQKGLNMHVTATEAKVPNTVKRYLNVAIREPVFITTNGRPRSVLLAFDEYERLRARNRRAVWAKGLTGEHIAAIEASEMAPGFEHLNAGLEE